MYENDDGGQKKANKKWKEGRKTRVTPPEAVAACEKWRHEDLCG